MTRTSPVSSAGQPAVWVMSFMACPSLLWWWYPGGSGILRAGTGRVELRRSWDRSALRAGVSPVTLRHPCGSGSGVVVRGQVADPHDAQGDQREPGEMLTVVVPAEQ